MKGKPRIQQQKTNKKIHQKWEMSDRSCLLSDLSWFGGGDKGGFLVVMSLSVNLCFYKHMGKTSKEQIILQSLQYFMVFY